MAEKELEEIREKLYDMEILPEADVWQQVHNTMRRRRLRKAFYYAMSSAAVIAVAFMILVNPQKRIREVEMLAAAAVAAYEMTLPQSSVMGTPEAPAAQQMPAAPDTPQITLVTDTPDSFPEPGETTPAKGMTEKKAAGTVAAVKEQQPETTDVAIAQARTEATEEKSTGVQIASREEVQKEWSEFAGEINYREYKKRDKEYTLAFNGGIVPGSSATVSGPTIMATSSFLGSNQQSYIVEQVSDTKYSLPLNLGVQVQFPVGQNLALGVGVNYTMLRSKFDCLVNKVRYNGKQTLHYIGVPVNVYGVIARNNNFTFYLNGGVMFEKGLRAKYEFKSYKDSHSYSTDIDGIQFSLNAGMGVEYSVSESVGLYFEPNIVYFTNSDVQYSIRTDQPLQIKGELGCRFHF